MKPILFTLFFGSIVFSMVAQDANSGNFISLFDGHSLDGWTPTEDTPNTFVVKDGQLLAKGGKAHLFYTGDVEDSDFENFELKMKVKTMAKSNSGVYFHTRYQKDGWPKIGFEAQVNSMHSDPKKTGSLYNIVNIWAPLEVEAPYLAEVKNNGEIYLLQPKSPSTDGEWFDYYIKVMDKNIIIKVNGLTMVNWTQPIDWSKDRRIGSGTIGLQAHDPTCEVYYKDIMIKILD